MAVWKNTCAVAVGFVCLASYPLVGYEQTQAAPSSDPVSFEHTVQPFLAKNCYACHNAKMKTADVDFTRFKTDESTNEAPELWEKAAEKLKTGAMPPKGMPRPKQADIDVIAHWMDAEVIRADQATKPDPGRITAHRLNRAEYNNTIRDLLAVNFHPADDFPQDDSGYGFDNIGDVLSLSPVLMERYLNAADKVVHTALYGPEALKPTVVRHQPTTREFPKEKLAKTSYDLTGLSMPNALHVTHDFPVTADYTIRTAIEGRRPNGSEPVQVGVWLDGKQVQTLTIDGKSDGFGIDLFGAQSEFRLHVPAGEHWVAISVLRIYEGLPPSYGGLNPSKRPIPPPPDLSKFMKTPPADATPEQIVALRKKAEEKREQAVVPANRVYIHYMEVVGPFHPVTGPSVASREKIFICGHQHQHNASCSRLIVSNFAHRAFRRPVTQTELEPYLALYAQARKQGSTFDDSIGVAMQAILVSPDFLFRIERSEPPAANPKPQFLPTSFGHGTTATEPEFEPISQYALASRLSYFLWSSMPDAELMRCADQHTLRNPAVLKAQVERMLKDPKSKALVDNFAGQWLELRRLESVAPDHERFPQFDDYLRMSMRKETELFFQDMIQNNRSILDFLDSKTTFLNQKLAEFYGIPGVQGTEFRRVSLEGTNRSGVLTQASILTVSSYATRTSPVLRGKWILENLLNAPPPPPPPNVPRLDESKAGLAASIRQQMEEHRANPMCASCHTKMDPLGFAFENYSAIGQWRSKDGPFEIDATGKLPDGRSFQGAPGLETLFRQQPNAFAECVTDKLLTYALGRGLERYDRPTVKNIVKRISADDYRFSSLVMEIVNSLPFEMRRGDRT